MLIVSILYHAKSRLMEIEDISSDEQGKTVATTGDNLGTRLQFTFDDPEETLVGYGARVDFDVLLMNEEGRTYKPFIMLNSEGYVDIPDGILSQVKCGKLPIQLVFGKAVGETDYRFNSLNQIELAINRAINSVSTVPEDVPGVEDAVVQVDYDSEDATFTFTRLDGSLITITLSDLHDDHFEVQTQADLITLDEAETGDTATALDTGVWYKLYGSYDVLDNWYPMPGGATMNGQPVTFPTFYAPITSGTDGQYLESKGENNAPVWKDKVTEINGSMQGSNVPTATAVKSYVDTNEPRLIIKSSSTPFFSGVAELPSNATNNDYAYVTGIENNETFLDYYLFTKSGNVGQWTKKYRTYGLGINQISNDWNNVDSSHLPSTNLVKTALDTKVNKTDVIIPSAVPTLAWGQTSSLGSVDGKSFQVTMPANPDTDAKTTSSDKKDTKLFLVGAEVQSSSGQTTYSNDGVYIGTDNKLYSNGSIVAIDGDVVHKTGNETIGGVKTFTTSVLQLGTNVGQGYIYGRAELPSDRTIFGSTTIDTSPLIIGNGNFLYMAQVEFKEVANTSRELDLKIYSPTANAWRGLTVIDNGSIYMTGPNRTYNANNTTDVVTIGSLQASTDVVHTSGNETIAGTKTFSTSVIVAGGHDRSVFFSKNTRFDNNATNEDELMVGTINGSGALIGGIAIRQLTSGSKILEVQIRNSAGTGYNSYNLLDNSGYVRSTTPSTSQNDTVVANTEWVTSRLGNYVTLDTAQTITGKKTISISSGENNLYLKDTRFTRGTVVSSTYRDFVTYTDSAGDRVAIIGYEKKATDTNNNNSTNTGITNFYDGSHYSYIVSYADYNSSLNAYEYYTRSSYRTYDATHTNDVVTIGSLQASTDVVHTSGNETIAGTKIFSSTTYMNAGLLLGDPTHSSGLEIYAPTPFIDYHFNNTTQDWTTRLINNVDGEFTISVRKDGTTASSAKHLKITSDGYVTAPYRAYSSASNDDVLCKGHVPDIISANVSNQQISLTSSRGVAVDSFTLNQMSGKNIVLPAGSTQYQNQSVTFSAQSPADFNEYPYMASLSVTGLTADMYATVTFSDSQVSSGQYAPFCQTVAGAVRLYAKSNVGTQTIPTISIGMDDSSAQQSMSNFVTVSGNLDINNTKRFTGQIWVNNTIRCSPLSDIRRGMVTFQSGTTTELLHIGQDTDSGGLVVRHVPTQKLLFRADLGGTVLVPNQRSYSASNTNDVITIGSLQASTDVVHTAGNETINGKKTISNNHTVNLELETNNIDINNLSIAINSNGIVATDSQGNKLWQIYGYVTADGKVQLRGITYDKNGNYNDQKLVDAP